MQSVFPNYLKTQLENLTSQVVDDQELIPCLREYLYSKYGQQRTGDIETSSIT